MHSHPILQRQIVGPRPRPRVAILFMPLLGLAVVTAPVPVLAQSGACDSLVPAAIGGPIPPKNDDTVVLRWLANANYEVSYRGQVFLFDTYFNRKPGNRPIGFSAEQVNKADAIFIGHAHFDHISDVAPVERQTGAPVVGAPITIETAVKLGVPAEKTIGVKGGETLKFGDVVVDVALAHHSQPAAGIQQALANIYKLEYGPESPQDEELTRAVRERGTFSPDVITKGTMAFGLTFPNGFKVVVLDSAGPITEGDRALAEKIGRADVAVIAYQAHAVGGRQADETFPLIKLFNPQLYLPSHHDASFGSWLDLGLEPLFERLRDQMPQTRFLAPLYRSPVCVATSGAERGKVVSFRY
jgi:L-ascorbate metabolism protein UlaG (beta-lactamase superfamily)